MIKKAKRVVCFYFLIIISISIKSQDTISVMAYNVLNYNSSNIEKMRYNDLKVIISYAKPDVVLLCEVINNTGAQLLLDSAFNLAGAGTYSRSAFVNGYDTDNMLYYKTSKIKLKSQTQILTSLRDISQYIVYYIINPGDTAWMHLHSAHLKAGSTQSDISQRNSEAISFCSAISSISQSKNILIAGDFNFYGSSESAWATLTSAACSHIFYDPISQVGAWSANIGYKSIHTQSTRSSLNPGCCGGATGGLDDRFDFILTNGSLLNGTNKIKVIPSSYSAIGNDANHFNLSLISAPTNTSVPVNVAQALFNMSDHLPVYCKFKVSSINTGFLDTSPSAPFRIYLTSDNLNCQLFATVQESGEYLIKIYNSVGSIVISKKLMLNAGLNSTAIHSEIFENGIYFAVLDYKGNSSSCILPIQK